MANQLAPPPYPSPKGRGVITEIPLVENMRVYELTGSLVQRSFILFFQAIGKHTLHFTPLPLGEGKGEGPLVGVLRLLHNYVKNTLQSDTFFK